MTDEKKKAKADKLASKGQVDEAVRLYKEAGYPWEAARLLESKGKVKEASGLWREIKGREADAVRCLLSAGLEDEARQVYEPVPENWSEWSDLNREYYERESSSLWFEYIQELVRQGKLGRALRSTLKAEGLFGRGNWEKLVELFRSTAADKEQPELWARLLLENGQHFRNRDPKGNVVDKTPPWEVALAFFRAGLRDDAFKAFDEHGGVQYQAVQSGWWSPKIFVPPDHLTSAELLGLSEFLVRRYVGEKHWSVVYQLIAVDLPVGETSITVWQVLPDDLQREVVKALLEFRFHSTWSGEVPEGKFLEHARDDELSAVLDATNLYLKAKLKDEEIEEYIISYAERIERYDAALYALERLCRFNDAIKFLDEVPPHMIWPQGENTARIAQQYKEKLEFKMKRIRAAGIEKPKTLSREELDEMFALGEITKKEFERMKKDLE